MAETAIPDALQPDQMKRPFDFLTWLVDTLAAIGTIWTFGLMFLVVADVSGRDFFNRPIVGVAEMAGNSIVGIVFLQLAAAINAGRMTRATFLLEMLGPPTSRVVRAFECVFCLLGAVAMAVLVRAAYPNLVGAYTKSEFFGVQGLFTIPTWRIHALIVIGSALSSVVFLRLAFRYCMGSSTAENQP